MDNKINELIEIYCEERKKIEMDRKHLILELKYQIQEQMLEKFSNKKEEPLEIYDEYFKEIYYSTKKIQDDINSNSQDRLNRNMESFFSQLNTLLLKDNELITDGKIVDDVMNAGLDQIDELINNSRSNPKDVEVVSTMGLIALLDEIKNNI